MFGIDDAILGSVAGSVVGGLFGGGDATASQTASKEPWKEAQPWILDNIKAGQDLQRYYQNTPFSPLQQNAYANLFGANDYTRSLVPGLLSQLSQPIAFDRSNPNARPAPMNFSAMGLLASPASAGPAASPSLGLLGDMNVTQNPFRSGAIPAPMATPAPTPAPILGNYVMVGGAKVPVGYDRETYGGAA